MDETWDCIVVGGGAAGLSAALVLGRARRRTLVVDAGGQSNLAAAGIGGLLGHDHRPPAELYAAARSELAAYPSVDVRRGEVVGGARQDGRFELELADGAREAARRVLLATGMEYRLPPLPGIAERFGRSVFHCPFCHGWELRERPLCVLDRGATGVERAVLLRAWSDDVALLTDGPADLGDDDAARLRAAGVTVDERRVAGLRGPGDALTAVVLAGGDERPCGGLLVPVTLHQRSSLGARLGATAAPAGPVAADALAVDGMFATTAEGVYAAGDTSAQMPSVANAIAAGAIAAAGVVRDLMSENGKCALSSPAVVPSAGTSVPEEESQWPQTRHAS
jgi:thioredoxin reductase